MLIKVVRAFLIQNKEQPQSRVKKPCSRNNNTIEYVYKAIKNLFLNYILSFTLSVEKLVYVFF